MKITYLSGSKVPSSTANSVHVMKMCQAFSRNGNDVTLVSRCGTIEDADPYEYYGVENNFDIEQLNWPATGRLGTLIFMRNLARYIGGNSLPDLFYSRHLASVCVAVRTGVPTIMELHSPPRTLIQSKLMGQIFRRRNFRHLVVISQALADEFARLFPTLPSEKILVAHDGADPPRNESIAPLQNWPGRSGRMQIGYIGHLYSGKGMEVIPPLAAELLEMDFHVVGGTEKDLAVWANQESSPNLIFHGFVPHGQLASYFDKFDVVLAPYQNRVEGVGGDSVDISRWMSPLKIFEYMAFGKPIIASDLPVLREVLEHSRNCILCPATDVTTWVNALRSIRDEQGLGEKIGLSAKTDFLNRYTWEKRAEQVLD